MSRKQPRFKTEEQEAHWRAKNQNFIADRFEHAKAMGKLGKGTVAHVARERAVQAGASPTITIRLPENDLIRARAFAAEKGLRYQTYLKMLLHEALNSEEKNVARQFIVKPLRTSKKRDIADTAQRVMSAHDRTFRRLAK